MPMVDPFTPDAFSLNSLTAAINHLPYQPGRLGELGLFAEAGINTLDVAIEEKDGALDLVPVQPRGGTPLDVQGEKRRIRKFTVAHLLESASILADEVQGVRAFGSENTAETLQMRINERLAQMRRNIDYTIESHRVQAIQGKMVDHNGDVIDLYTAFGVTQTAVTFTLSSATAKLRQSALDVIEAVESGLGGLPFTGIRVFCAPDFWRNFIEHDAVKGAYDRWENGAFLRSDPRAAFEYAGLIWERYRGTSQVFIPAGTAIAVPEGVPDLLITRFGPADYNETVNTIGMPYYARSEPLPMNKGWQLEAQSNPVNLCTRPQALIKLVAA